MVPIKPATAIVTGASKRVGAVISKALVDRGWTVVAHVRSAEDTVGEGMVKVVADLALPDCASRIFESCQALPAVRLLVNNAARFAPDSLGHLDAREFELHMAINLRAPVLLSEALAERHEAGGTALIVNLLDSKLESPNPDFLSYTLSKFALREFGGIAARAWAEQGIRVNAIAPALMLRSPGQSEANYRAMHSRNPLGRGVEPAEVVAAIDYLIGAPSVTGQTLQLDGGQRFLALPRDVQFLGE